MNRNYGTEIDELKKELNELKNTMLMSILGTAKEGEDSVNPDEAGLINQMPPTVPKEFKDPKLNSIIQKLYQKTTDEKRTGSITYMGVFSSGGNTSLWIRDEINTDKLLSLIENKTAAQVLQSIGNNDRLNLLLALLQKPMNVAGMVKACGFNTTGQVYHHLKPLISADLVKEAAEGERGVYAVIPHRVQGVIMLLAGISDLLDGEHSKGSWLQENEAH